MASAARGTVISVHRQAVNVLLSDGSVVALLDEARPVHPWALCVPLISLDLRQGSPARASASELTIGRNRILLYDMKVEDLRLHVRPQAFPADLLPRLRPWAHPSPDESPFLGTLVTAVDDFQAGADPRGLASLLGLGEGLTPSGDDVLVGVLAGLDLARNAWPAAFLLRWRLAEALTEPMERRTTQISAQMLRAAVLGLYAEPVLALLRAAYGAAPGTGRGQDPGVGPATPPGRGPDSERGDDLGAEPAARLGTESGAESGSGNHDSAEHPVRTLEEAASDLLAMGHRSGLATLQGIVAALSRATDGTS